jgi:hypothetical protein
MYINLTRRPDWSTRLIEYITESQRECIKCDWEFNHCAGWVAGGIYEMTGVDLYAAFEGQEITSPYDAYMAIKRLGYSSLEDYITSILPEKPLVNAQRGDVVFVRADGEEFQGLGMSQALGFAFPPLFYALGNNGLGKGPIMQATRCFAVGGTE